MLPHQYFSTAAHLTRSDHHLGEGRVEGELHHASAASGQGTSIVQRSQYPQLVHRIQYVVLNINLIDFFKLRFTTSLHPAMLERLLQCTDAQNEITAALTTAD